MKKLPWLYLILAAGILLRLIFVGDMEWKSDEQWMFERAIAVGRTESWPWLGIASGVYLKNPGMSVWVFVVIGRIFGAVTPTDLARAVQILNCLALVALAGFARRRRDSFERELLSWTLALAAVNPFAILYHRKIWAQSVLPFFSMLFLICFDGRDQKLRAFFWGLIGACLGQVHMSGFFFAFAVALVTFLRERLGQPLKRARWSMWIAGSALGALPLLPWFVHLYEHVSGRPTAGAAASHPMLFGWGEAIQFKAIVFWITNSLGIHLGNTLGVVNGNSWREQLGDFLRYPLVGGHATYLMAISHAVLVLSGVYVLLRRLITWRARDGLVVSNTGEWLLAGGLGYCLILTASTIVVHRYYLLVSFPLEFLWLASLVLRSQTLSRARGWLTVIVACQLAISATFIAYIHQNGGSTRGDYGVSYRLSPTATQ